MRETKIGDRTPARHLKQFVGGAESPSRAGQGVEAEVEVVATLTSVVRPTTGVRGVAGLATPGGAS
jgi:hypothetical protein